MVDHAATTDRDLHCVVVTPEKALLDETAEMIVLPMYDGELGVLPGRAPLIGRLGHGELRIRRGGQVQRFFVDGGFAQVRDNVVTVLTSRALKAEQLQRSTVEQALRDALEPSHDPQVREARQRAQDRARAQLRILDRRERPDH